MTVEEMSLEDLQTAAIFFASLFATIYLAIQVSATPVVRVNQPVVSLPFTKLFNLTSGQHLVRHGQARAEAFMQWDAASAQDAQTRAVINAPAVNQMVSYVALVGVGSNGDKYQLVVDTGSSNTWVGANKQYVQTSTSTNTGDTVSVKYGSGQISGSEYMDRVSLGWGLVIQRQSIGVATQSQGFNGVDGILGIGPTDLTKRTLSSGPDVEIPTVTDTLFSDRTITSNELSVSFELTNSPKVTNGVLTWGGIDRTKFTGSITWIPLTGTAPANRYWGIDAEVQYGASTSILSGASGIVDTGSTLTLIATDAFEQYKSATGAVEDSATGFLSITSDQFRNLQSIFVIAGGSTFELTPNAQLWPRRLNTQIGGTASNFYLVIGNLGGIRGPSGGALDFILGQTFLERFYSVYDAGNQRVGLAKTRFTTANTN